MICGDLMFFAIPGCRDDWIRTSGLFVPNEARYRAALHPERHKTNDFALFEIRVMLPIFRASNIQSIMKKNRPVAILKKVFKIFLIVLILLVGFAFAAPYVFKGKIIALVKNEINKSINAKADFKDVDISFFRSFPKVSLALENLQIIGDNEFANDTLIAAKAINVSLDIMSVVKGSDFKIYSISVDEPRIHALVLKDGSANWDIAKEDDAAPQATTEEKPFTLNLQHYAINNGYIFYDDATSNMRSEIINLNHEGNGDFSADLFTLFTKTSADAVSFSYGGIPYLSKAITAMDADIIVDNKIAKYSFQKGAITLNELVLATEGFFQLVNDSTYGMDIKFDAPATDFKNILSLVPAIYKNDFKNIKTSGKAVFNGFVKGTYSENEMPAYNVDLAIQDGFFQYPDLPLPVKNINLTMNVKNPDGVTDHTVVDIPKAHIDLDNEPFDFRLLLKTPVSDMFIDAAAKGKLDLSKVSQFTKLEKGTRLSGLMIADINIQGKMSAIEQQRYEQFNAAGILSLKDFLYASKDYPEGVSLNSLLMTFNPKNVTVSNVEGQYMKTNFSADGTINNLLGYVLKDQTLDGTFSMKADQVNLDDWMGVSTDTVSGTAEESKPFLVPSNIQFVVNTSIDKVHYDRLDLHNLSGSLRMVDETVHINNVQANALDGTMAISGSYSTKDNKLKPSISLTYDVKGLDVQKTFYAFNTLQKIMPVGKFISGKLSSKLSFTGQLGDNMMPDLNSLTGAGNLLLIEGFLKKFAPVDKLAQNLNIKELETISLRDVKNHIQFTNGKVLVKPFTIKAKEIDMEIGGMHGLDQSMDYIVNLKLPRSMMGDKGNQYIDNLISQVSNKGVPVKVAEVVNLHVLVGGTITNPVFKTDLKQAANSLVADLKQQATDFAKQKIDSTKTAVTAAVKDTIASVRKQATDIAREELKRKLAGEKDTTSFASKVTNTKLEETGKGLIQGLNPFKKKKPAVDSTKSN